jgi:uncharacterized Ntn-hydrolase superfamily protein
VTYSLVARDAATGELGVAVQSRSFGTGAACPWARAGVGAVATQSFTLRSYGPRALDLMAAGNSPAEALAALTAEDELRDFRQVAIVDAQGRVEAHTGAACIASAGSVAGADFSAQGNMLRTDGVVPALAASFERAEGSLAERLLDGLEGAEAAGGDFRGREAGGIVVVPGETADPWERVIDLRVDNHPEPLRELRRLLEQALALRRLRRAGPDELDDEVARAGSAGVDDDVVRWLAALALVRDDPERAEAWLAPLPQAERWRAALRTAADALERSPA